MIVCNQTCNLATGKIALKISRIMSIAAGFACLFILTACQTGGSKFASQGASQTGHGYVSTIRASASLPALKPDSNLEKAARVQAQYMASAGKMSHDTGWRRDFATRMKEGKVAAPAAENLAYGRMDTGKVFEMWMNSSGHRKNMLNPSFSRYGLAHATAADGRRYWALVLSK
jgi:uncharacterized protein YkwD